MKGFKNNLKSTEYDITVVSVRTPPSLYAKSVAIFFSSVFIILFFTSTNIAKPISRLNKLQIILLYIKKISRFAPQN